MLSNPSQYSPQSLTPQFPGLQAAQLGPESGHAGFSQPFPLGGQSGQIGGQVNPFLQNPFTANPFAPNPYLQSQWQSPVGSNPFMSSFGQAGGHVPAHQIVPVLGQLAQQIAIQSAVAQQIGIAVHQLAHQLASQGLQGPGYLQGGQGYLQGGQGYAPGGYGGLGPQGQGFAQGGYGGSGPQGQGYAQGGYGGLGPQAQGWGPSWGANRPQTIQ